MTVRAVVLVDVLVNVLQIVRKTAVKIVELNALMTVIQTAIKLVVALVKGDAKGLV